MTIEEQLASSIAHAQNLSSRLVRIRTYVRSQARNDDDIVKVRLSTVLSLLHGFDENGSPITRHDEAHSPK